MKAWIAKKTADVGLAIAITVGVAASAAPAIAAGPGTLTISAGTQQRSWTADQLLHDPRVTDITIDDENLKQRMTLKAIPFAALLAGLPARPDGTATTAASDGYVSHLPMRALLADGKAQPRAWLAVENPAAPWPMLRGQGIGPFRLVWTAPPGRAETVTESYWTYNIERIDIAGSPGERYPAIRPAAGQPADGPVMRGFAAYQRVCLSCHSLNGAGDSHLGPDLNMPYSPVEYLGDDKLAGLIRNPQSLRWWPEARMPSIDQHTLPDAELKDLLAYFHHMAATRKPVAPSAERKQ
ncbi:MULTISPECIES: c-type cytochrome [Cupriavidus]|uniref:Cytochrome c, class I n=1 Tax=Cupriavidus pinatubonensis (strain JMP 134 / LMG 1197) TaxID=264198 RepID=Q46T20_CUPPJ|nr:MULTISPECIES: cytochrome c [Cupriavidus]QYY28577.1 cytochrome c [Cupriavidus pinatubonensis]TPQ30295.1 cytochrome c [Cupriavidus pinatubonensis]